MEKVLNFTISFLGYLVTALISLGVGMVCGIVIVSL